MEDLFDNESGGAKFSECGNYRYGPVWVKATIDDKTTIPAAGCLDLFIKYDNGEQRMTGGRNLIIELLESGWTDVQWLDESGTTPLTQDRADMEGVHNRTWGENEYPDLSLATPEQKAETINGLVLVTAREVLKMFLAFGLKTHIECTVVNDPTKEEFDFIFRKKGVVGREEDAVAFAEWLYKNRWFHFENGRWEFTFEMGSSVSRGEYLKNYIKTSAELYELFKQQKEK